MHTSLGIGLNDVYEHKAQSIMIGRYTYDFETNKPKTKIRTRKKEHMK